MVTVVMLILLCIILLFYFSDRRVCLLQDSPKMLKGKNASMPLCNFTIVSVKVITLNRSCIYEGKRTCLKMIKEQPHTQPLVTLSSSK